LSSKIRAAALVYLYTAVKHSLELSSTYLLLRTFNRIGTCSCNVH